MGELKHWTESTPDDFLYRISSDFVRQIEQTMEATGTTQAALARKLGISEGRVSQVLNNPGNLTLRKIIEYSRALGRKVSLVTCDDNDPANRNGPISAEVFTACWERVGKPTDFLMLREQAAASGINVLPLSDYGHEYGENVDCREIDLGGTKESARTDTELPYGRNKIVSL